jgi:hypothetical protein
MNDRQDVLARHMIARGGYEAMMSIHSLRMDGVYEESGRRFDAEILWNRPHLRVVRTGPQGAAWVEGFDGRAWEYDEGSRALTFTSGAAEAATRRGAEFDDSFVDFAQKGHGVELRGLEPLPTGPAYLIRVTLRDDWVKDYYVDAETYLVAALAKSMPLHAVGEAVQSLSSYEDYRSVSGVLYPFRSVERRVPGGELMNTLQWSMIGANMPLDDAVFTPPG